MQRRFFVTIFAPDRKALATLRRLELDLFGVTPKARGESSAGGLLTEADIEQARGAGFRVEVHEEYVEQGRGRAKKSAGKATRKEAASGADALAAGRRFAKFLEDNRDELLALARTGKRLLRESAVVLRRLLPIIRSGRNGEPKAFDEALVKRAGELLGRLGERGTPNLRRGAEAVRRDLRPFAGSTLVEALRKVDARARRGK